MNRKTNKYHFPSEKIKDIIRNALRKKMQGYKPETKLMPFHTRLLGKDRMALYSFVQSLNTNFGTSIYEPVALCIAKDNFKCAKSQHSAGNAISSEAQDEIQKIMNNLAAVKSKPNKIMENEKIKMVCKLGDKVTVKPSKVDLFLESNSGELYLIDIKTAKPNKGSFKEFKRMLLEWVAAVYFDKPEVKANSLIAIPYNPYDPKPYQRWTMAGMLDLDEELKVAEGFWNFLGGGHDIYQDLLNCFEEIGVELRDEIDDYFRKYNTPK